MDNLASLRAGEEKEGSPRLFPWRSQRPGLRAAAAADASSSSFPPGLKVDRRRRAAKSGVLSPFLLSLSLPLSLSLLPLSTSLLPEAADAGSAPFPPLFGPTANRRAKSRSQRGEGHHVSMASLLSPSAVDSGDGGN